MSCIQFLLYIVLFFSYHVQIKAQNTAVTKADSLYHTGDYASAISAYEKIASKTKHIRLQIARAHKAKGTYTDALKYYKQVLTLGDVELSTKIAYAKLLTNTGKYETADSLYTALATKYPDNPDFQYRLGIVKKKKRDTLAISFFKEAFRLDNTHQKSCFEVAKYHLKKRDYDIVWNTANLGLHSYPENVELLSVLGQSFLLQENYYAALPYFEKLLDLNQKNEFVHTKLALCYSKTHAHKKAILHFHEVLKHYNKSHSLYSSLAHQYQWLKKYDEALKYYHMALKLKDLPIEEDLYSIAMVYRFQENWEQAIKYIKRALKENPNFSRGQYQLAMLADSYYKDPNIKLKYYNTYLKKFESDQELAFFTSRIKKRVLQLEKEISLNTKNN
ncbi:tetratricopeptide repeat protein [Aquimarina sp. 2201CG1-2-11]|uniref:tetratricopeptide repeat protein n=1 Tax=Aquimarina discodermiae TaxID=3231043 RepID=UPI003462B008